VSSKNRFAKNESVAWTDVKTLCPCSRALAVIYYVESIVLNLLNMAALAKLIDCIHCTVNGFVTGAV
jgi:hypothetical protein